MRRVRLLMMTLDGATIAMPIKDSLGILKFFEGILEGIENPLKDLLIQIIDKN